MADSPAVSITVTADGEPPFDWMQWLTENWYIPAIAGVAVLALLWPKEKPIVVLSEKKRKRKKSGSVKSSSVSVSM